MRQFISLLALTTLSAARTMPDFDDELLGKLVVSKKKFPFLTPQRSPDIAHVYPTDQQLDKIKEAIGKAQFAMRMKRAAAEGGDGFPTDATNAFGW